MLAVFLGGKLFDTLLLRNPGCGRYSPCFAIHRRNEQAILAFGRVVDKSSCKGPLIRLGSITPGIAVKQGRQRDGRLYALTNGSPILRMWKARGLFLSGFGPSCLQMRY